MILLMVMVPIGITFFGVVPTMIGWLLALMFHFGPGAVIKTFLEPLGSILRFVAEQTIGRLFAPQLARRGWVFDHVPLTKAYSIENRRR